MTRGVPLVNHPALATQSEYNARTLFTGGGMTATFEAWITPIMIGGLILFMGFIIWDLAKQSQAGRFGTLMLFVVLGAGMLGYILKVIITWLIERGGGV